MAFLDGMGVLSDRTVMVHGVWVDERDLGIMRDRGVRVVHCPSANSFLGDGIALRVDLEPKMLEPSRIAARYSAAIR